MSGGVGQISTIGNTIVSLPKSPMTHQNKNIPSTNNNDANYDISNMDQIMQDSVKQSPFIKTNGHNLQITPSTSSDIQTLYEQLDQFTFNVFKVIKNPLKLITISETCDSLVKGILCDIDANFYVLAKCINKCQKTNTSFTIQWSKLIKNVQQKFAKIVTILKHEDFTISAIFKDRLDGQIVKLMDVALNDHPTFLQQGIKQTTSSPMMQQSTANTPTPLSPTNQNYKKRSNADINPTHTGKRYQFDYNAADVYAKNLPPIDMTQPIQQESIPINSNPTKKRKTTTANQKDDKTNNTSLWYCPVCLKHFKTRLNTLKHIANGNHNTLGLCRYPECIQHRHSIPKYAAHKREHLINDEQSHLLFEEGMRSWRARLPTDKTANQLLEEWINKATQP